MLLQTSQTRTILPEDAQNTRRPLLTPLPEPGHFLYVVDNSTLEGWKRCAMFARNQQVLERQGHPRNAALAFGGAIHAGLDVWLQGKLDLSYPVSNADYTGYIPGILHARQEDDDAFFTRIAQTVVSYFADHATPPDDYRTPANAVTVIGEYIKRSTLPDYQMEIMRDENGPLVERAFEIPLGVVEVGDWMAMPWLSKEEVIRTQGYEPLPNVKCDVIHVAWSGRIDLVARVHGKVRILDHKTTSIDGDQFVQSFQMASQTLGYVFAARTLFPDLDITSFCLDAIRLKRPGKGQGITDRGARGGEAPLAFFRAYFDYAPERVERWHTDTMLHISNFIHALTQSEWPMNDSQCFNKYGRCPYFDACSIDDVVVRDRFLASDAFAPVTWNPVR